MNQTLKLRPMCVLSILLIVLPAWAVPTPVQKGELPYQDLVDVDLNSRGDVDLNSRGFESLVNVVNGNLVHHRPDLSIPIRGIPLTTTFTYNSTAPADGPFGFGWQMNYALHYQVDGGTGDVSILQPDGRIELFTKQLDGSFQTSSGNRSTLEAIDPGYRLTVRTDEINNRHRTTIYHFDAPDHRGLTKIEDRNGNTLALSYDNEQQLTEIAGANNRRISLRYADNQLREITGPTGRHWTYTYSEAGDMTEVTASHGRVTRYAYDSGSHRLVSVTDAGNSGYRLSYDTAGRVRTATDPLKRVSARFAYRPDEAFSTEVTNGNGFTSTYTYDERGRVISLRNALGHTTHRNWNDRNQLVSFTDGNGHRTTLTYDGNGLPLSVVDALGHRRSYTWDHTQHGVTSKTDENGNKTRFGYDERGNLLQHTDALGQVTHYSYDAYGQMQSITDALDRSTRFEHDANGHLTKITDALGGQIVLTCDALGNLGSQTDAHGNTLRYEYDVQSRLAAIVDPEGQRTTYRYDAVGNLLSETDRNGHATTYTYDAAHQLITITNPLGQVTQFDYDGLGKIVSSTNALGQSTRYEHDAANRYRKKTTPMGHTWSYEYDAVGNLVKHVDAEGQITTYTCDYENRLLTCSRPRRDPTVYGYTPEGLRIWGSGYGWPIYYGYDGGRIISEGDEGWQLLYHPNVSAVEGYAIYPIYDHTGTSIAEIWPWEVHLVDFDEFGVKIKGSLKELLRHYKVTIDLDVGTNWNGRDPLTTVSINPAQADPTPVQSGPPEDFFGWGRRGPPNRPWNAITSPTSMRRGRNRSTRSYSRYTVGRPLRRPGRKPTPMRGLPTKPWPRRWNVLGRSNGCTKIPSVWIFGDGSIRPGSPSHPIGQTESHRTARPCSIPYGDPAITSLILMPGPLARRCRCLNS